MAATNDDMESAKEELDKTLSSIQSLILHLKGVETELLITRKQVRRRVKDLSWVRTKTDTIRNAADICLKQFGVVIKKEELDETACPSPSERRKRSELDRLTDPFNHLCRKRKSSGSRATTPTLHTSLISDAPGCSSEQIIANSTNQENNALVVLEEEDDDDNNGEITLPDSVPVSEENISLEAASPATTVPPEKEANEYPEADESSREGDKDATLSASLPVAEINEEQAPSITEKQIVAESVERDEDFERLADLLGVESLRTPIKTCSPKAKASTPTSKDGSGEVQKEEVEVITVETDSSEERSVSDKRENRRLLDSTKNSTDLKREMSDDGSVQSDVVDDEDLELQKQIQEERKAKRKTSKKETKCSKRKPKQQHDDDEDVDDRLIREAEAALRAKRRKRKVVDVDELSDEDDNDAFESEDERKKKNGPSRKKTKISSESSRSSSQDIPPIPSSRHTRRTLKLGDDSSEENKPKKNGTRSTRLNGNMKIDSEEELEEEDIPKKKNTRFAKDVKRIGNLLKKSKNLLKESDDDEVTVPVRKTRKSTSATKRKLASESESSDEENESTVEDDVDSDDEEIIRTAKGRHQRRPAKKLTVSSSDEGEKDGEQASPSKKRGTKKIMSREKLEKTTIDAEKAEKERRKRLEQKQKEFNGIELADEVDLAQALSGSQSIVPKLKSVVLDPDSSGKPPVPVAVHPSLVRILKPHQAKGVQFMYDCTFESLDRLDEPGGGGILAHCMGLGKTLQVITFLHTIMNHPKLQPHAKRILVVVPKNVVLNWYKEFDKWLENNDEELCTIEKFELDSCKTPEDRLYALENWFEAENPAVMIIGYDMFRILTSEIDDKKKKGREKKLSKRERKLEKMKVKFREYLQDPGPDVIVCDEAHKLKNDESALTKTMVKIRTVRRICLTGTPLQNNLMEYHCMVNFVKPGLLGTKGEFANRFANIITRGRVKDATDLEVQFMRKRCHVLYEHLKKCVDRKDYRVLTEAIPPKQEYVINVRLTERQCKLYRKFIEDVLKSDGGLGRRLLPDYHVLSRIWTHPYLLLLHEERLERERILKEENEAEDEFIDDGSGSESEATTRTPSSASEPEDDDVEILSDDGGEASKTFAAKKSNNTGTRRSRRIEGEDPECDGTQTPPEYSGWFASCGMVSADDEEAWELSNKLTLLIAILKKCEEIGDKLLVFSQSLESLGLIKNMLRTLHEKRRWFNDGHEVCKEDDEKWGWIEGLDYMVIDGSVQSMKRDAVQTAFNNPSNLRARLMLISTRAGSLGTNMVAANRVIIFDACWNPSHDTQSLFRVYRFGQTKPVYIYRFIAQGTMEERIYKRQVTKESTSMRVVDEAQIQRHYDGHDLEELYLFDPDEIDPSKEDNRPSFAPPKDRLLADVLHQHQSAVVNYFQHDTLFAQVDEEKLTEEELKEAWADYENEKKGTRMNVPYGIPANNMNNSTNVAALFSSPQNLQMWQRLIMQHQYQNRAELERDPIFANCFRIKDMTRTVAVEITNIKIVLEQLLPRLPENLKGGLTEFNSHFMKFIHQTVSESKTPDYLLRQAIQTFRTVVNMVRSTPGLPHITAYLRDVQRTYPNYFDPSQPPF